jgi:putative ABC transport system permease protein
MQDKVNAVLVSNRGDELSGAELTSPVSRRLAVLAMDETVVAELAAAINTPATLARLHEATAGLPEISLADGALLATNDPGEAMPGWLEGIAGGLASLMPPSASRTGVERFLTAVTTGASTAELRELIGNGAIRDWLLTVPLPEESAATVADVVGRLNQFEQVAPLNKQTLMTTAQVGGGLFSTIFTIFGVFSILAAMLLIFLIVVMLAAERRTELGIARAIGVQRADVVRMFTYEGIVYAVTAAAIGVPLGILVSWAMTQFMGKLLNDVGGTLSAQTAGLFGVEYHITGQSIAVAYCLGVVLTYVAIWWSARSASALSITAAIRNLPDAATAQRRHWTGHLGHWLVPLLILLLGVWLAGQGANGAVSLFIVGLSIALAGLGMLITRSLALTAVREDLAARITYTIVGAGLLLLWVPPWYAILPYSMPGLFGFDMAQAPTVVTVGGPVMIIAAVLTIMFNADAVNWLLTRLLGFIPRIRPVLKTALSYPLADRFRTGMTMALFAMIMATVVVMAVIISTTAELTAVDERTTGGFDIEVSSTLLSFFNPLADAATVIQAQPVDAYPKLAGIDTIGVFQDVSLVATSAQSADPLVRTTTFTAMNGDFARVSATVYPLAARAGGYDSDAAIWQALATQDDVVVVKKKLFATAAGFPATELLAGGVQRPGEGVLALAVGEGPKGGSLIRNPFAPFQLPNTLLRGGQLADVYLELAASQGEGSRSRRVKVIGVLADDTTLAGGLIQGSDRLYAALAAAPSSAPPNYLGSFFAGGERTVIKVAPGAAIDGVAGEIEKSLAGNGMDAAPLVEKFAIAQNVTRGVLQLLQGFMALGLLVGIAALGVVAARSVVERRQQIGVLRALGFETNMVVGAFLLEASFISITGLLIGAVTGVVLGDNIVGVFFPMFTEAAVRIPWGQIAWLTFFAYFFAILVTISAAYQAAQIAPADALRYE